MTLYLVWSEGLGFVAARHPLPVPIVGYEGALLFVAECVVEGRTMFAGYESRAGHRLTDPQLTIGNARGALIALTVDPKKEGYAVPMTRAILDAKVTQALAAREASVAPTIRSSRRSALKTAARIGGPG